MKIPSSLSRGNIGVNPLRKFMQIHQTILVALASILISAPVFSEDRLERVRKAADQGDANAQNGLGDAYSYGHGFLLLGKNLPEDKAEGLKWWRKAADQGDSSAQEGLGSAYYYGNGVPEDKAESVKWWRKIADRGILTKQNTAQFFLGLAYERGKGVPEDYVQAYMWYNLASAKGYEYAKKLKLKLSKKMTKEQIAEAQKLSTQWVEQKAKEKKK